MKDPPGRRRKHEEGAAVHLEAQHARSRHGGARPDTDASVGASPAPFARACGRARARAARGTRAAPGRHSGGARSASARARSCPSRPRPGPLLAAGALDAQRRPGTAGTEPAAPPRRRPQARARARRRAARLRGRASRGHVLPPSDRPSLQSKGGGGRAARRAPGVTGAARAKKKKKRGGLRTFEGVLPCALVPTYHPRARYTNLRETTLRRARRTAGRHSSLERARQPRPRVRWEVCVHMLNYIYDVWV